MKRYLFLTLFVTTCSLFAKAQTTGKDSLLTVMAKEICTEISDKDYTSKTGEELQMEIGLAIVPHITSRLDLLKKVYGMQSVSQEDFGVIAKDIGVKLVVDCPEFMKIVANNSSLMGSLSDDDKITGQQVSGTLQKIVPGDFTYFQVKDPNGKLVKIWWMERFEGSEKLSDQLLNKPVVITYDVKQIYNAQMQNYTGVKVATKLQVIQ